MADPRAKTPQSRSSRNSLSTNAGTCRPRHAAGPGRFPSASDDPIDRIVFWVARPNVRTGRASIFRHTDKGRDRTVYRRSEDKNWRERWKKSEGRDRKSTRLNSSHGYISYAVFCLKKKKQ